MRDNSFKAFQKEFADHIASYYEAHENSFDFAGIHGRKHISRAIVLGECMAQYYARNFQLEADFEAVRTAIAFHDAGREGNGRDLWEQESADLCRQYLLQKGKLEGYADTVAAYISDKASANGWGQIVYDADVLEIMRLFCNTPNGFYKFRRGELHFLGHKDILLPAKVKIQEEHRLQFIREAWELINCTEEVGVIRVSNEYLGKLIEWIGNNSIKFPFIWKYLD